MAIPKDFIPGVTGVFADVDATRTATTAAKVPTHAIMMGRACRRQVCSIDIEKSLTHHALHEDLQLQI